MHRLMNAIEWKWKLHYSGILTLFNIVLWILLFVAMLFLSRSIILAMYQKALQPTHGSKKSPRITEKRDIREYNVILQNNPFGMAAGSLKMFSPSAGGSGPSDLKLIGTISGRPIHGYAIIADKDGKQVMFRTGESVFDVGKLR